MDHELEGLARAWGVETGYHDVFGNWHVVPPDVLRAVIEALGAQRPAPARFDPATPDKRAFQGNGRRHWGLAVQLYGVRSKRNWGIGDFADLHDVITVAARAGASAVGLNPLHTLFLDRPDMASPYAPNSRLFLNPFYVAVDQLEWFDAAEVSAAEIEALQDCDLVDYAAVAKLKLAALRRAYRRFLSNATTNQKDDFETFRKECGDRLKRFACFEVLRASHRPRPWSQWPSPWSHPGDSDIDELHRREFEQCGFFEFLQWIADRQLAQCRRHASQSGMSIGLYLDVAVGVDPSGSDAWSNQKSVMPTLSIGAPPDELNRTGQNWGLVPFNPHALPDDGFAVFRKLLAATMRYAGAVRLDHVLGLMRLYLIPNGSQQGAYVRYPFEQLLNVVAEEGKKYRCIFIGEDLGTVPEGFRETAARWGVWSYRVMMFERRNDGGFKGPHEYPTEALATFNTHDLPTFSGWMSGEDLSTKRAIGMIAESDEERSDARSALRACLSRHAENGDTDRITAAARFLAETPSRLVTVSIEDLLGVVEQVNIPGTVDQHPNWRRKLPLPIDDWESQPVFAEVANVFRDAGRSA